MEGRESKQREAGQQQQQQQQLRLASLELGGAPTSHNQPWQCSNKSAHPPVTFFTFVKPCCSSHWLICMLRHNTVGLKKEG